MIYNLQRFDTQAQIIHGMTIYTFDDEFNLVQVIGASTAAYTSKGWKLMNGTVTTFKLGEPFPSSRDFKEKQISIAESPKDFQEIEKEVDGLKFKELHRYIESMKNAGADTKSYEVKYHSRISTAFIPIVMCFLAVPFSIGARREGGLARDLSLCLAATFFYWLFYSVGLSLGSNGALQPWAAAWLPSLIFFGLATGLIARKT
jgi:lipopolysaccharide export system permease protein